MPLPLKRTICLLCRSGPLPHRRHRLPPSRWVSSLSATSIKTSLTPTTAAVADGLMALARGGWVGEARVRLALRGLMSDGAGEGREGSGVGVGESGVRVAVLGHSGSEGRLVATLLDDPLTPSTEPAQWVDEIKDWWAEAARGKGKGNGNGNGNGGRALLIRYGPPTPIITAPSSPLSSIFVPSPLLSTLSLLLTPLPPTSSNQDITVLPLPATHIPGARIIEYPVHKTLLWAGEGAAGLSTLLNYTTRATGPVLKALSLPNAPRECEGGDVRIVDLGIAEAAMSQTGLNAATYQREMSASGLANIALWIKDGTHTADGTLKPVVRDLAQSIITEAEDTLLRQESELHAAQKINALAASTDSSTADTPTALSTALKSWSQAAHTELQSGLASAFQSKPWRELAWWKLLWAADDVASNTREVLATGFLVGARENLLFLAGRFEGAGFRGGYSAAPAVSVEEELAVSLGRSDPSSSSDVSKGVERGGTYQLGGPPPFISEALEEVVKELVPALQSAANKLLIKSATISGTGGLTSALLWCLELGAYESLSVTALAVVYSARMMQVRWEKERRHFGEKVRERGRVVVAETERWGWQRLKAGIESKGDGMAMAVEGEEVRRINDGKVLIESVKRALEKV